MMNETAKILRERMKDEKIHTVCLSGKKTGKEAEEKQNQWNLISNNGEGQDWGFQIYRIFSNLMRTFFTVLESQKVGCVLESDAY
jgi:hypothetical protein